MIPYRVSWVYYFQSGGAKLDCGTINAFTATEAEEKAHKIKDRFIEEAAKTDNPVTRSVVKVENLLSGSMFGGGFVGI